MRLGHSAVLFGFTIVTLGALAFACTVTSTVGENADGGAPSTGTSTSSSSGAAAAPADAATAETDSGIVVADASSDNDTGTAPSCTYITGSGSSSSGSPSSCAYGEEWTCGDIDCSCPSGTSPGTCTCGADTFTHDCSQGCTPTAADRARCKIPTPPTSDGGSTSSSGGI